MNELKLLTLNCQRGHHANLRSQLKVFFQGALDASAYDFLLLQEVNATVFPLLQHPSYRTIRVFDEEAQQESELCIVYRSSYAVTNTGFKSFAPLQYREHQGGFKCPTFGVFWTDIDTGREIIRLVSIHLHSDTDRRLRLTELKLSKDLACADASIPTVIAGDFNSVFPGEKVQLANVLAPEFTWATKNCAPTLDSRYCDNGPHLLTRISYFLGRFNIGISFQADHIFVNNAMASTYAASCRVLPDRVSDHNSVEAVFTRQ